MQLENIPKALKKRPQWICWKAHQKGDGKITKPPYDPRINSKIDGQDPKNHLSFEDCVKLYKQYRNQVSGIGFVFTKDDPFTGVNLDDCFNGVLVSPEQNRIIQILNSYSEISPSGKGVKIWVEGRLPGPNKKSQPEMYSDGIFFTTTGERLNGHGVESRQKELELLYFQYYPAEHPKFGEFFSRCNLMRFLLEKSRSGINLSHSIRRALASFSNALNELDADGMPFITLMLSGCPDFDPEVTRKQLESLKGALPYGCAKLKEIVRDQFADFRPESCSCNLAPKDGRKPSPIRFLQTYRFQEAGPDEEEEVARPAPLPAFPLEVVPEQFQRPIWEVAEAFRVPIEIPACNLLSMVGSCIGRTRKIIVTPTWYQHANLWIVIVGRSGIGKSHCMEYLMAPVRLKQKKWYEEYTDALVQYDEIMEIRKKASKEDRADIPRPDKPQRKQIFVDDVTSEALAGIFEANPRGILWIRDEISGLLLDLDKYSGQAGSTKARLMSSYDSGSWSVDRISRASYIPNACLSMFGGIQPKYVSKIFSELDADMGFLPRFLFVIVNRDRPAVFSGATVSEASKAVLDDLIFGLLDLWFNDHGEPVPVTLDIEARQLYLNWHNEIATEVFWKDPHFESVVNKLQGQCLRIALNLHYMDMVARRESESLTVYSDVVLRAIKLTEFFKAHQKRIWDHMMAQQEILGMSSLAERVLHAILALESKIEKGKLPTARITDYLNLRGDERSRVESVAVGKTAKELGLKKDRMSDGKRSFAITPEQLQRLRELADRYDRYDSENLSDLVAEPGSPPQPDIVFNCQIRQKIQSKNSDTDRYDRYDSINFPHFVAEPHPNVVSNLQEGREPSEKSEESEGKNFSNYMEEQYSPPQPDSVFQCQIRQTCQADKPDLDIKWTSAAGLGTYLQENEIRRIFIDTETTGLDPHQDKLALIQVLAGDQIFFLNAGEDFNIILEDEKILKVFHNAKFDLQFLRAECRNLFDTYLAERLLTTGITPIRELSLAHLSKKYLDIDLDKSLRTSFKPHHDLTPEQIEYAAMDVKVLEPIFEAQKTKLKEQGLIETALLEFSIVPATAQIELSGMLVDLDKLEILKVTLSSRIAYLEEELRKQVKDLELSDQKEFFGNGINFRSPDQTKRVLQVLGFELESTGEKILKKIDHPFAKTLLEHRSASKQLSSFVEKLPKHINSDTGRIHPEFHQLGTDTGRYTCSKPNLQQIPREQEWRDLFVAAPRHKIITADYSQIELRILAEFSQDETFFEAYRTGKDLHQATADQIGISRGAAKAINFGLCYGMSSTGLAERLGISSNEAQSFISAYFRAYPRVKDALDQLGLKAVSGGYSETPLGRKRYFKPAESFGAQKSLERKGRNAPIQSTCTDILKKAISYLMADLRGLDVRIVNLVHDEIVIECPEGQVDRVKEIVERDMIKAGEDFLKSVPVEVEIKIDKVWRK